MIIGTVGSVFAASIVAHNEVERSHQNLITASRSIASRLNLAIQTDLDLAISIEAFVLTNPTATNSDFLRWVSAMQVTTLYPEVSQLGFLDAVRPDQLSQFEARVLADPPIPLTPGQAYQVTPPGTRPFYCLTEYWFSSNPPTIPADYDACANLTPPILDQTRVTTYIPDPTHKSKQLTIGVLIYPGGTVPRDAQTRSNTFLGLAGLTVSSIFILNNALVGHPRDAVSFKYGSGSSAIAFNAGSVPPGGQSSTVDLKNGWHVQVFAVASDASILTNSGAFLLLLAGTFISLLLGALVYTMGTSRSRALTTVEERTEELNHLALHDPLTGLPNRALILDRIEGMIARSRREQIPVAVLFLDLDNFKDINDTLGHGVGDELLVAVGTRLVDAIREEDSVGRLGGDEFVILAEGASLAVGAEVVAARILDELAVPFQVAGNDLPLNVTASIGIAEGDREIEPDKLLRNADIALYQAKEAGKKCAMLFTASMQDAVNEHRDLEVDLLTAFDEGQFFLLYQPTIELSSGVFSGVEALLRWRHPIRGVIQPDEFVPALESTGLIVPVGRWVLEEACRQGAEWQRQGHPISVSINVSAVQLIKDEIVIEVGRALDLSGLHPTSCVLELTETTLMHNIAETMNWLTRLKALGVRLAIDDFGTGYSSLAYLQQFPIDILKIDRTFISQVTDDADTAALVHAMVQLGKSLQIEIVAEGIENHRQRAHLIAEGVEIGQGYFFAGPLDVERVNRLLGHLSTPPWLHVPLG